MPLLVLVAVAAGTQREPPFAAALADFREGRYEQARVKLQRLLVQNSRDAAALHLLGLVEASLHHADQARAYLETSVTLAPNQPTFAINLARFWIRQGKLDAAEEVLQASVAILPRPETYETLGLLRLQDDKPQQALGCFTKSLALAPDRVNARYYVGLTQQSLGQFDAALEAYEAVLLLAPSDFYAHLQSAKILLIRGNLTQALAHLRAAEQEEPSSASVHLYLSRVHLSTGDLDLALRAATRAVRLKPNDSLSHYQLSQVLARLGRMKEAKLERDLFEKYRKFSPANLPEIWQRQED